MNETNSNQKKRRNCGITFELCIIIAIAFLMMFLIKFVNYKYTEIITSNMEGLLMNHDPDNPVHGEFGKEITKYHSESCKLIEVFDENFEPMFELNFKEESNPKKHLDEYKNLIKIFKKNQEGHTTIKIDDITEDVYFRWSDLSNGKRCLVVIYMSRPIVKNLWIFSLTCYLILVLTGILLVHVIQHRQHEKIKEYRYLSKELNNRIFTED